MQVAKYWRTNQLRYRLNGVVQKKVDMVAKSNPVKVSEKEPKVEHTLEKSNKVA